MTSEPEGGRRQDALTTREVHLSVPGARLYVREVGAGVPLVVLHGGPEFSHNYFLPQLDAVAAGARLIYYDQRGRGRSGDGVRAADTSIASETLDIEHLRQWLGSPTIALLGHSWGGVLAMEYAVRYPDRVTHLVLMNTAPVSHQDYLLMREARTRCFGDDVAVLASLRETPGYTSGDLEVEHEVLSIIFRRACHDPTNSKHLVPKLLSGMSPAGVIRSRAIGQRLAEETWLRHDYDLLPALGRTRAATLVIHGEQDFIPSDGARRVAQSIPGGRFALLADCGHFAFLERPTEVRRLLHDFLVTPSEGVA